MNIKKISALLLAVLLIASTAVFSVSAVSQSYSYIYNYALKVKMDISSTGGKKPYAYYYYDHSYKLAEEILSLSEETESIELQNKYDELKDFYENPWIRPSGAGYTCYYAVNEKNDNNWYSDEIWNTFVEKREKLFNALSVNNPNFELKEYGEGILDKDYHEFWGFEDDKLFEFAKHKIIELSKSNKPFDFEMLTVDTHHPYGYQSKSCKNLFKESLSNSIYHTDENLKDFMEWLKKQDFYENTVIVIQGDHTSMAAEYIHDTYSSAYDRRVWNTFIHSRVKPLKEKNRDFTTMDFYPTILAALGYKINGDKLGLGTNLFSDQATLTEALQASEVDQQIKRNSNFYRSLM